MKILQNSEVPIYKQIAAQFKDDIMNGVIPEGEYLPSIRGLARDLKISDNLGLMVNAITVAPITRNGARTTSLISIATAV